MADYIIIGIIAFSLLVSLFRGFVREVLSLVTWIAAFFVASRFYPYLAVYFTQIDSPQVVNGIAIAILFICTLIVGGVVNHILGKLVDKTGLSGTDRVLGALFGVLRGVLIVAALLFIIDTFTGLNQSEWWKTSQLIPHFKLIIVWFFEQLQQHSSFLNEYTQ